MKVTLVKIAELHNIKHESKNENQLFECLSIELGTDNLMRLVSLLK